MLYLRYLAVLWSAYNILIRPVVGQHCQPLAVRCTASYPVAQPNLTVRQETLSSWSTRVVATRLLTGNVSLGTKAMSLSFHPGPSSNIRPIRYLTSLQ